jgi:Ser/Thr protein kinase RdoA (MazF antagonist)
MKTFRELSRRGRLHRLRELADSALDVYGLKDANLKFLQYNENVIYRVDKPGSHARAANAPYLLNRYVLRLHAEDDADVVASELVWLAALDREARLPVPAPVTTPEGGLVATVTTPNVPNGRVVSLLRWLDGRKIQKGLRPSHLAALGRAVAQLHEFAAVWKPPKRFTRFTWDWDAQLGGSMFEHSREELIASMPRKFQEPFEIVSQKAKRAMLSLGTGADAFGMIHADLYPENVLFHNGQAYPTDFEDCGFGYWMWDIAVALCKWAWDKNWEPMRDAFYDGYSQVRALPESQWKLLDLFVATQFATMLFWASEFLKHDPMRKDVYLPWRNESGENLLGYFRKK